MGLDGMAGSLAALSRHEPAARLFGACEALSVVTGFRLDQEIFDGKQALGLSEFWARDDDLAAGTPSQPPIRDSAAIAAHWEAGRQLTLEQAVAEALAAHIEARPAFLASHGLSPREVEVLRLLAEGDSNRRIADRLSISQRTVERHVLHILDKLGLNSRTAAAMWAVRHGLA
jgi:DNA-binding CsgD family transcriptional regulator